MARPRIVRSDSEEREFKQQRLERLRQRRRDPEFRARDAERKRLKRQADRELREREARAREAIRKRLNLQAGREVYPSWAARCEPTKEKVDVRGGWRHRIEPLIQEKSVSAADCASSKTWPSLSDGKCDSQTQCLVPLMFKASQATLKTPVRSFQVQTRAAERIITGSPSVSALDCGSSTPRASLLAGKCDFQAQCVVPLMFKSCEANSRAKLKSVRVQTEFTRKKIRKIRKIRSEGSSKVSSTGGSGDQASGGHHFGVP